MVIYGIKNYFLGLFLLLLFLAGNTLFLPSVWQDTYDFLGLTLPNVFSRLSGHPTLNSFLLQRFSFFLLGIGFIIITTFSVQRLSNNPFFLQKSINQRNHFYSFRPIFLLISLKYFSAKGKKTLSISFRIYQIRTSKSPYGQFGAFLFSKRFENSCILKYRTRQYTKYHPSPDCSLLKPSTKGNRSEREKYIPSFFQRATSHSYRKNDLSRGFS